MVFFTWISSLINSDASSLITSSSILPCIWSSFWMLSVGYHETNSLDNIIKIASASFTKLQSSINTSHRTAFTLRLSIKLLLCPYFKVDSCLWVLCLPSKFGIQRIRATRETLNSFVHVIHSALFSLNPLKMNTERGCITKGNIIWIVLHHWEVECSILEVEIVIAYINFVS